MDETELELFNDSLGRCLSGGRFFEHFYDRFLACSDEVRHKFRNTDMRKQRRALRSSFHVLMLAADGRAGHAGELERIAARHSKQDRDIPPHLYDLWLDCLLQTVREHDRRYSPDVEHAWRNVMEKGISVLKAGYGAES